MASHTYTIIDKRTKTERWSGKAADAEDALDKWVRKEGWGRFGNCHPVDASGNYDDVFRHVRVRIT